MQSVTGSKRKKYVRTSAVGIIWAAGLLLGPPAGAIGAGVEIDTNLEYLKGLDIGDLLNTEVISVSKKKEKLVDTSAAIFVITSEDIERTGAKSIPEALRMVPGIQVANITANKWSISSRGFADLFANKLLVLVDGRSVYTPLFSGVNWELQDTVMEDIERIEVIRGPGATIWGANAVNGVINIITKSAAKTEGTLLSVGSGDRIPVIASGRYGGRFGDNSYYRLFVKGADHDSYVEPGGDDAYDSWQNLRSGFRIDSAGPMASTVTLQGDVVKGQEEINYFLPGILAPENSREEIDYWESHLLGRMEIDLDSKQIVTLQAYYDYSKIDAKIPQEDRHTFDLDLHHQWQPATGHDFIWGLGYRVTRDDIESNELVSFSPESRTDHLYSAFIQDEYELVKDAWWVTAGTKLEHNEYTGFEVQPSIRTRIKPGEDTTIWAAVSRAVRTPSRSDHDLTASYRGFTDAQGVDYLSRVHGNERFDSEKLIAYEAGFRWAMEPSVSFDLALFYNDYEDLRASDQGRPRGAVDENGQPYVEIPFNIRNGLYGETYGMELLTNWQPSRTIRLSLGYTLLQIELNGKPGTDEGIQQFSEGDFPEHQLQFRSYLDLPFNLSFDSEFYYVDELSDRDVDAYFRLDLRLAWKYNENITFSLNGENLLDAQHDEFGSSNSVVGSEVPRQFFGKVVVQY